jgi:hypothetical protein
VNVMRDGMMATSFVQGEGKKITGKCYCCGVKGHAATTCPERATRPREEWYWYHNSVQLAQVHDEAAPLRRSQEERSESARRNAGAWNL